MSRDISISENIADIRNNIAAASRRAARPSEEIMLLAVSKTMPVSDLEMAYGCGIRDFGENKVQELCGKYEKLPKDIRWHMIGHLQRNKVKYIIDKAYLIHSVDSYRLAAQIEEEAKKKNITANILIEVNIAMEESKFGLSVSEVYDVLKDIGSLPHVRVKGLMTVAPYAEIAEKNRKFFNKLKQLSVDIKSKNIDNISMDILSMGMTGDYETAIEEGATIVRVGSGIFGERNYAINS